MHGLSIGIARKHRSDDTLIAGRNPDDVAVGALRSGIGDENSLNRVVTRGKPVEAERKAVGLRIDGHGAAGRQMFPVDTESGWTVHSDHLTGFDLCRGIFHLRGPAAVPEA